IDDLASKTKTLAGHNLISGIIDFFSRGLITKRNFLSVSRNDLCGSIESAVDWSNANPSEQSCWSSSQPPPPSAIEVCEESLLCLADPEQRQFLEKPKASPSPNPRPIF
ncbi:hypothetical protein CISIN_1g0409191mg, partial [Citrus sinensis]